MEKIFKVFFFICVSILSFRFLMNVNINIEKLIVFNFEGSETVTKIGYNSPAIKGNYKNYDSLAKITSVTSDATYW